MDIRRLEVFVKVYELRSFSKAADAVLLSQPTVSGHIKVLEDELGVKLFDRLSRKILPTRPADLLYRHAVDILARVREAAGEVDAMMGRFRGELKLGGSTIPGQYVLPVLLGEFRKEHPEVRPILIISDTSNIIGSVANGDLEFAMVGAAPDVEHIDFTPLCEDVVILVVDPGHALAGKTISARELVNWPVTTREPGSGTLMFVSGALEKAGVSLSQLQLAAQLGSTTTVLQGARHGVGAGFVSRIAALEDLQSGRLAEVTINDMQLTRRFYLITREEKTHSPAAKAFMDLMVNRLGSGGPLA